MPGQPIKCTQMADVRAVNEACKLCSEWERDRHTGRQTERERDRERGSEAESELSYVKRG